MNFPGNLSSVFMENEKAILAIETSDIICGASIFFGEDKFFSAAVCEKHSHSEKLFPLVDSLMRTAEIQPDSIGSIAISEGPGSFTGLRIGMTAAKSLAIGWKIPIIPVPTFEAIAFQVSGLYTEGTQFFIANKVNKDEVYLAKFQISANSYIFVNNLQIAAKSVLDNILDNELIFGNVISEVKNKFASPAPEFVAKWAKRFGESRKTTQIDFLEPNYLKKFLIKEKVK